MKEKEKKKKNKKRKGDAEENHSLQTESTWEQKALSGTISILCARCNVYPVYTVKDFSLTLNTQPAGLPAGAGLNTDHSIDPFFTSCWASLRERNFGAATEAAR